MTIIISGKPDDTASAKKKLLTALSKQYEIKVEVPKEHLSALIGKGGSKLKALQDKTGARITVPKADDPSQAVTLSGDKTSVEEARKEIHEFLKEKVCLSFVTFSVDPPFVVCSPPLPPYCRPTSFASQFRLSPNSSPSCTDLATRT